MESSRSGDTFGQKSDIELGSHDVQIIAKCYGKDDNACAIYSSLGRQDASSIMGVAGKVINIGSDVFFIKPGDKVVGLISSGFQSSGSNNTVVASEINFVPIPEKVTYAEASATVGPCLKAYTALHYLAHLCKNETVLLFDAPMLFRSFVVQLALHWGASRVFCVVDHENEKFYFEDVLKLQSVTVLENVTSSVVLQKKVLQHTAGLGVDIIIDSGINMHRNERGQKVTPEKPEKHDIISMLAVGGRWVTSQCDLQLDPPDSELLFLKSASLAFLFELSWLLSPTKLGKYQHMLRDGLDKIACGSLNIVQT